MSTAQPRIAFNGINGDTGTYDLPQLTAEEMAKFILGEAPPENLAELRHRQEQATERHLGVIEGIDPKRLDQAGWGVIFPTFPNDQPEQRQKVEAMKAALQPLLKLRGQQAGDKFKDWTQGTDKGFRVGADDKNKYLKRYGAGPGAVDPDHVPYYLLIVGSPNDIPYRFQSQLDVQYAVGRIYFDTIEQYATYADNIVAAETSPNGKAGKAAFFGTANPGDDATARSSANLVQPVATQIQTSYPQWTVQTYAPEAATKATLKSLLGGDNTPALLFTASHGMAFNNGSARQLPHQGALLCQDWPGPFQWSGAIPQDFYFAGDDLEASADLQGMIAFFFACYGGGTPQFDDFSQQQDPNAHTRLEIAPYPFLAQLPMKMLGRPHGAAAVIAHVERTWTYSFDWHTTNSQTAVFTSALKRLIEGHPIGSAVEFFNERYAELSTMLSDQLESIRFDDHYDPFELADMWTANNDARGYTVLGDPFARLQIH